MARSSEKTKALELGDEELGEIAGGEPAYANSFQCIPAGVTASTGQAERIAGASAGDSTLKR